MSSSLDGEIQRLTEAARELNAGGDRLRDLPVDTWQGPASAAFQELHPRLVANWYRAADLHDDAATALRQVRDTRQEVDRLLALHRFDPATRPADLARLTAQANEAAEEAAGRVELAARALTELPRLLPDDSGPEPVNTGADQDPPWPPGDLDTSTTAEPPATGAERRNGRHDGVLSGQLPVDLTARYGLPEAPLSREKTDAVLAELPEARYWVIGRRW